METGTTLVVTDIGSGKHNSNDLEDCAWQEGFEEAKNQWRLV